MKIIVPVSGGKDSQLCLQLALQQHGVDNVIAVHNATNYDHPLTNQHLKDMEDFYKVKIYITYSDKYDDVFDFIEKSGSFPSSLARSCTSALKQKPFGPPYLAVHSGLSRDHLYVWSPCQITYQSHVHYASELSLVFPRVYFLSSINDVDHL